MLDDIFAFDEDKNKIKIYIKIKDIYLTGTFEENRNVIANFSFINENI